MREEDVTSGSTPTGDEGALAELARREGPALTRFAYLLTRDSEECQDLVQAVLFRLAQRGIADLQDPAVYARRCLVNLHRSQERRRNSGFRALRTVASGEHTHDDHASVVVAREAFKVALSQLTPRQRAAVILRYYEDLTDEDIAHILSCAPGTVRSLLSRAMPVLKRHLTTDIGVRE